VTTTEHKTVFEALAAVQAALPRIGKDKVARVETKTGASYEYAYTSLAEITAAVFPLLEENGLVWTTLPTLVETRFLLRYRLFHVPSETELTGDYPLPMQGSHQDVGGGLTYARRYSLTAVLGIVPDDDDDATRASSRAGTTRRRTSSSSRSRTSSSSSPTPPGAEAEGPASAPSRPMMTALHASLSDYGLPDRESKLTFVSGFVGRELTSSSDLTRDEVKALLDHLQAELREHRKTGVDR
jgi:hypothetical protein